MKTAIEPPIPAWTTDELTHRLEHGYPSVERLAAAAMLRTQAAEIERLTDALEQIKHSITQMQMPGNDKRREVLLIQNIVALALAKETP